MDDRVMDGWLNGWMDVRKCIENAWEENSCVDFEHT